MPLKMESLDYRMHPRYFPTTFSTSLIENGYTANPSQLLQPHESFYSYKSETAY